jgi:arsenite/tail-anchored protein-transporting ATPase
VAVFHAFSRIVNEARSAFVVLDTAPTGHSDAADGRHRRLPPADDARVRRHGHARARIVTPLMRLQDAGTRRS